MKELPTWKIVLYIALGFLAVMVYMGIWLVAYDLFTR